MRARTPAFVRRALVALAALAAFLLVALAGLLALPGVAWAYTPPAIEGPVTDPSRVLSDGDKRALNEKLRRYKTGSGYEIAIFVVPTLDGNTIEDVSYDTARAWGIGKKGKDDGVLIAWAPKERKVRIETGKGVGGALTDIESFHIQRDRMNPLFKQGRNREALEAGVDGVAAALGGQPSTSTGPKGVPINPSPARRSSGGALFVALFFVAFAFIAVILVVSRFTRRRGGYYRDGGYYDNGPGPIFYGGSSSNDSWSSGGGSSDSSWSSGDSGGGGGGGDWGGGGGDFGGGGSSSDY